MMVSKWQQDLKGMWGTWLFVTTGCYGLFLASFIFADADYPKDLFYLNELFMIPLVTLVTVLVFQKEFGGYFSEVFATFPLKMWEVIVRKFTLLVVLLISIHLLWVGLYWLKFGQLQTVTYDYANHEMSYKTLNWLELFSQSLPSYLFVAAITVVGLVFSKKVYGGLGAGFGLWMLEVLTGGGFLGRWTLFTIYIPTEGTFTENRVSLIVITVLLGIISVLWAERRGKWVTNEDMY
ncbi:hypothetical protein MM221_13445 [Salipaludibacillus sp. LMS25]|uniref:hypothetical protein n=1 Tax=Salipaludibacillus sp. LMS25 TaxID=2924031 RepID=UPI0020D15C38|nr:hypothetical protein [Salipaludibacillus sp. LMS25]UTR13623.1 hypothetical protein MM221_13445 [Salipaludibacillus sp. LMS25]